MAGYNEFDLRENAMNRPILYTGLFFILLNLALLPLYSYYAPHTYIWDAVMVAVSIVVFIPGFICIGSAVFMKQRHEEKKINASGMLAIVVLLLLFGVILFHTVQHKRGQRAPESSRVVPVVSTV